MTRCCAFNSHYETALAVAAQQLEASGIMLPAKDSLKYKAIERRLRVQAEEAKIALSEDDDFMLDFGAPTQLTAVSADFAAVHVSLTPCVVVGLHHNPWRITITCMSSQKTTNDSICNCGVCHTSSISHCIAVA